MDARQPAILFFDGVCTLCNRTVDALIRLDRHAQLRYAPLQGRTARSYVPDALRDSLQSVVLKDEEGVHIKSEAALRVMTRLGGFWKGLALVFRLVPRFLRDLIYDDIAKGRYQRFGKRDTCRIPTPAERNLFLD